MDDPALSSVKHAQALTGLERLNKISGASRPLWSKIERFSRGHEKISVLELATGGGDVLLEVTKRSKSSPVEFEFTGSDVSETAIKIASKRLAQESTVDKILQLNALDDDFPQTFDIVMTSLFTHHLDPDQVILLLKKMYANARIAVIVSDLERSALNWAAVWAGSRILSSSPVVHYDGPVSVRAAYTPREFTDMAKQAGLKNVECSRIFSGTFFILGN